MSIVGSPLRLQRRGGGKAIMAPERSAVPVPKPRRDQTLIKPWPAPTAGGGPSRATGRPIRPPGAPPPAPGAGADSARMLER
jgi:hypothetical protein